MPEYGLTKKGFLRKPYTEIIKEKEDRAKGFFGEDVDLSERSPLGLFLQSDSWEESKLWDEMEKVYYSAYIDDAEGKQLDGLVKYVGLKRKPARKAYGYIEITGIPGKTVDAGTKVMTESSIIFETTAAVILDENGYGGAYIEAVTPGKTGNVTENKICSLFNPVQGINKINNPERTSGGTAIENDEELRERYYRSLFRKGKATRAAVEAALLELDSVKDAYVIENASNNVVDGIPPKSLAPFVFDGGYQEIAEAILDTKSGGIQSYGEIVVNVADSTGYMHEIGFTKAKSKDIFVRIILTKNSRFKPGYEITIRTTVINYIGGLDYDGTEYKGLGLGRNVMRSKIIALADGSGIDDAIVLLSTDGIEYGENNIDIPIMQIAVTDYEKVMIT